MYLAKIAMDIVAKKAPPDSDGVRIAELDEKSYQLQLWTHIPLTDFWQIGPGIARRLKAHGMYTMGDIAAVSIADEGLLYDLFGINAELLIDHAWGIEPTEMSDIKNYKTEDHSLSTGQVLPRPYRYDEGLLVFREMADLLCADLFAKDLTTPALTWWVSYDPQSLEELPAYEGPLTVDFYGRVLPKGAHATVKLRIRTNSKTLILDSLSRSFEAKVDHRLLVRRLGIAANDTRQDDGYRQLDLFTDFDAMEKERSMQRAMLAVRRKYGLNAVVKGMNLLEGATTIERNQQIGGHRAGSPVVNGRTESDDKPVNGGSVNSGRPVNGGSPIVNGRPSIIMGSKKAR